MFESRADRWPDQLLRDECAAAWPDPTPGVAMLTHFHACDLGIMISASHNPAVDNGIKFSADGLNFPMKPEAEVERAFLLATLCLHQTRQRGRARRIDDGRSTSPNV
jgi:phosphoglucosamine mutase